MYWKNTLAVCGIYLAISTPSLAEYTLMSTAERAYSGPEAAVMYNVPNGGGSAFTSASIIDSQIDATITLTVRYDDGTLANDVPREDIWLESVDGGLVACCGGTTPDTETVLGVTKWVMPLHASGSSEALTRISILGNFLETSPGLAISHNSPDLNGSGVIDLTDAVIFASDFYGGGYQFRSDFAYDGSVNLSDAVRLAQALSAACTLPPCP